MRRSGSKLFRTRLRHGGIGLADPPPADGAGSGGESEMDWASGEEAKATTTPTTPPPTTPPAGGMNLPGATNPTGSAPNAPGQPAPGQPTPGQPTPGQPTSVQSDWGFIGGLVEGATNVVGNVVDIFAGQPAPEVPGAPRYVLDMRKAQASLRPVRVVAPQAPYDQGMQEAPSDLPLILGAAGLAGLGYWLMTRKKGRRK